MTASVTLTEHLTDAQYAHRNVARAAARRGDHLQAVEHLSKAETTARALQYYYSVRNGGKLKAQRWQQAADQAREQIRLAQAFIAACLQNYVQTIHTVDGIECDTSGEYRKVEATDDQSIVV